MMKQLSIIFLLACAMNSPIASARMIVSNPGRDSQRPVANQSMQTGRVDSVLMGAGKIVIGGVAYAYNPLSTVFMINGKRGTISDVHPGDTAQFQQTQQGSSKIPLLTSLSVQR